MNPLHYYSTLAIAAGCVLDQIRRFIAAEIFLQPKQLAASAAARLCDLPNGPTAIGYGGARGGGKSHWLLAQMGADDCQRYPGLKCLLLRKVGKANTENLEDLRRRLFGALPHEFSAHRGILTFANGSRIIAGHFQNESDIDHYLGLEYDVIGIEEATTLSRRKYVDISTCSRSSKRGWRPRIYSTTNPGGVGHAWYKEMFISNHRDTEAQRRKDVRPPEGGTPYPAPDILSYGVPALAGLCGGLPRTTLFIHARVEDNQFNNPEYRQVLDSLTGWQKRAWRDGDWDLAAGQYFTNFRRDIHVRPEIDDMLAREWFAALDYGYTHYTVCLLGFKDGDGNVYIVDEHAERQWLPERHAAAIREMLARHHTWAGPKRASREFLTPRGGAPLKARALALPDLRRFVSGADVFGRQWDGATIAQQYARLGIKLTCANMDRVNGWAEILRRLGEGKKRDYEQEQDYDYESPALTLTPNPTLNLNLNPSSSSSHPSLFIHARCRRLIECLPALQHDPNRPEDVLKCDCDEDGLGGDDPADALRYLVSSMNRRVVVEKRLEGVRRGKEKD